MDSGADRTQKIVITVAVILAIIIVFILGYSLYNKASFAEDELAKKMALEEASKIAKNNSIKLTNAANKNSGFQFNNLVQKNNNESKNSDANYEVVNEVIAKEEVIIPKEPEEMEIIKPVNVKPVLTDEDRPLTLEEILKIRALPVAKSPTGALQLKLEVDTNGEYSPNNPKF